MLFLNKSFKSGLGTDLFPNGLKSHPNNCCVQRCVDSVNQTIVFCTSEADSGWQSVGELITHSQILSPDCKHDEFNTNKQTLVSIHSRRWIKQQQSLSTPLISPLSQAAPLCPEFADSLLLLQFNIKRRKCIRFLSLDPSATRRSFNSPPR